MLQKVKESADYIVKHANLSPKTGIILGSGLGAFESELEVEVKIPFSEIPHFPVSGVEGHKGALILGRLNNVPIVVMQGRVHFYEGYSMAEVTYPIRVLGKLGITKLFLTNAAGGMNPAFEVGNIMLITDHINLMPNPLLGPNIDEFGPRFPDMSEAYSKTLLQKAREIARAENINLQEGVYVGVTGPTYETPAEYNYMRIIGGDAVGMSTIPEVIIARHMGIECFAMSVITDLGIPGKMEFITHEIVQREAAKTEPYLAAILREMVCA